MNFQQLLAALALLCASTLVSAQGPSAQQVRAWAAPYSKQAFDAKTVAQASRALGLPALAESREVTLTAPDVAENGASVAVSWGTQLPGVRQMLLLVDKNPTALVARFALSDAVDAQFSTRIKMAETGQVYAVAVLADGCALFARKEVKVTLGGCGA